MRTVCCWWPPSNRDGTVNWYLQDHFQYARRPMPRHNGGMNVGYLDGHVKWENINQFLGPLPEGYPVGDPRNTWDNR